jgi:hypothetical protein
MGLEIIKEDTQENLTIEIPKNENASSALVKSPKTPKIEICIQSLENSFRYRKSFENGPTLNATQLDHVESNVNPATISTIQAEGKTYCVPSGLFINNVFEFSRSGKTFPVENPSNGCVLCHVCEASIDDVDLAVV